MTTYAYECWNLQDCPYGGEPGVTGCEHCADCEYGMPVVTEE